MKNSILYPLETSKNLSVKYPYSPTRRNKNFSHPFLTFSSLKWFSIIFPEKNAGSKYIVNKYFFGRAMAAINTYSAANYSFKVNNGNTKARCEICSKLTLKTKEQRHWRRSGVFVTFENISHLFLVFLLLTLSK